MRKAILSVLAAAALAALAITPAFAAGGRPPGAGNGRGGGETTTSGNNLSNPVVFASNVGILGAQNDGQTGYSATWTGLRIPPTAEGQFTQSEVWNGATVYPQAMPGNSWQATWLGNGNETAYGVIAN